MARMLLALISPLLFLPAPALAEPPTQTTETLQPFECGSVKKLHTLGGVFLAGQPAPADFEHVKNAGIRTVINLRLEDELEWNEKALVKELGLSYVSIPFKTPESLTDAVFDEARAVLNDAEQKPILLHCASANRVGAVWLVHRVLDGGITYEEALAEAKTVGLALPAYETRAQEYIKAREKK